MKRYPFKFLDAYTRDDRGFFFGRDEEIARLYEMVFQGDLLLLYGASGTGKTSLIQCGLAAHFQSHDWLPLHVRRGKDLNASLNAALLAVGGDDTGNDLDWIDEDLSAPTPSDPAATALSPLGRRLRAVYMRHFKPIYLIFDQFEELYILGSEAEQQQFIHTVQDILRAKQPVKIILSIREEYLGYLYEFERAVPELLRKKLRIEPMTQDRVTDVLLNVNANPLSNVHLAKGEEKTLAEEIFKKIRGKDKTLSIELPYLQVFLDKLYLQVTGDKDRQAEATFSLGQLNAIGDIGDVLRDFLDEQVLRIALDLNVKPETIWKTLSPFVTLEGTKEPLSAAMLAERLRKSGEAFIPQSLEAFQRSGILRFDKRDARYEIAHDSLARQIHAKRTDEEIALLEVQRLIRSQAAMKPEAREYFTARQLEFMAPFLEKFHPSPEELDWIRKSRTHVQAQQEAEERRQREELEATQKRLRMVRGLLALALIAALAAGYFGYAANKQKEIAEVSLAEVRLKNISIFESFTALGTELIYHLDHAEALEKLKVATGIEVDAQIKKQRLSAPLEELLFFFAESGRRPELARNVVTMLLELQPSSALSVQLKKMLARKVDKP